MYQPPIGCHKSELDTPVICIDLDAMEENIQFMSDYCQRNRIGWRPHSKCHKSSLIANKLIDAGAIGATCAKLGEAEVLAAGGVRDILIANLIVGQPKVQRLAKLRQIADPIVCVDHMDQANALSAGMSAAGPELRVLIEIDIGLKRVGVLPGPPVIELARQISELPGLQFAGVMAYEGHLLMVEDPREKTAKIREALDLLTTAVARLEETGLPCSIVSCGGTGSYLQSVPHPGITEVQAGGLIFMDAYYRFRCHVQDFRYAMTVLTTVVGRPAADRAIIDAGRKTMNQELHLPFLLEREDIRVKSLSAEHGTLELDPTASALKIGDQLEFIPGYSDFTTVLHDAMYAFRRERLEQIIPLEARGRLQ